MFVHKSENDHFIDWENVKLLYESKCLNERLIVENILIKKSDNMNLSLGMYKLDEVLTNRLIDQPRVKRALNLCLSFNGAVT